MLKHVVVLTNTLLAGQIRLPAGVMPQINIKAVNEMQQVLKPPKLPLIEQSQVDLPARGVEVEDGLVIHVLGRHHWLDDKLHQVLVDLVIGHIYKQIGTVSIRYRQPDDDTQQVVILPTGQSTGPPLHTAFVLKHINDSGVHTMIKITNYR